MLIRDPFFDLSQELFNGLRALQSFNPESTTNETTGAEKASAGVTARPARSFALLTDIYETEEGFLFEADLPGVREEDLDIELDHKVLTIRATRHQVQRDDVGEVRRTERRHGVFERSFTLGDTIDIDSIQASFEDGVLTLKMAKMAEAKPRKISVNGRETATVTELAS